MDEKKQPSTQPRIILCHLNIELQHDDPRSMEEIENLVKGIIEVGQHEELRDMKIVVAMTDEM